MLGTAGRRQRVAGSRSCLLTIRLTETPTPLNEMIAELAVSIAWVAWLASWILAARWSDRTARRPAQGEQALYRGGTVLGAILLFVGSAGFLQGRDLLWPVNQPIAWLLVAVVVLGLAVT